MKRAHRSWIRAAVTVGSLAAIASQSLAPAALAQDRSRPATVGDLARLEAEIREQRTIILQLLKSEQERSQMMLRLLEGRCGPAAGAGRGAAAAEPLPPAGAAGLGATAAAAPPSSAPAGAAVGAGGAAEASGDSSATMAALRGRVQGTGGDLASVHVYLEGMRSSGKGKTLEIVQKGKQFSPQLSVAVAGTKVTFPNRDIMFHNVFSPSPKPFDLGTRQAGEVGPPQELDTPGVVEVYCNIHSKMSAKILVVPNRVYVRVSPDGSFRLDKVPVGRRKLVAWGPGFKPQRREIEVTTAGAELNFTLEPEPPKQHPNKLGMPYGSYKE